MAIEILHAIRPLPDDTEFWVSPGERDLHDWPMPVFARHISRATRTMVGFPMEWHLHPYQSRKNTHPVRRQADVQNWDERQPQLMWRGSNSYCVASCELSRIGDEDMAAGECLPIWHEEHCHHNFTTWLRSPRSRLVYLSSYAPDLVDAKFTRTDVVPSDPEFQRWLKVAGLTGDFIPGPEHVHWKYLLSMDGTSGQQSQYLYLHTGALVLFQESPLLSWLNPGAGQAFRPGENMIRVRHDLADLVETLEWLRLHDVEAAQIAQRGRDFATANLDHQGVLLYVARCVFEYTSRVKRGNHVQDELSH